MPIIELITIIQSDINIVFDLSRSIDLHKISTAKTNEEAIAGKTSGLIELNEYVTWEARHLGVRQRLSTKITAYNEPHFFIDEQMKGAFKSFKHIHEFKEKDGKVIMKDIFTFESPFGIFGKLFNALYLTKYMEKLLKERNDIIKEFAESDKWMLVLKKDSY